MKHGTTAVLAGLIIWAVPVSAYAYLDPNVGSMLLQGLVAGFAAAGVVIKTYWHVILGFFKRHRDDAAKCDEDEKDGPTAEDDPL
jgi:hypothetical protein